MAVSPLRLSAAVAVLLFFAAAAAAAPAQDEVKALPTWNSALPSKHYSGYLNASDTKHLHYYFVEAYNDPQNAPLVFWTNGGPGCSSLDGFIYEHGPFRLTPDDNGALQLTQFEQTWVTVANMLYLEAPVGVGFSYSDDPATDYKCTDDTTANDSLKAVEAFFEKFPEMKTTANGKARDFFLTGESYGGIYVPTLAEAIVKATKAGTYKGAPLKGIAVGNGCTGTEIGVCGGQRDEFETEFLLGTAFVLPELKEQIRSTCKLANGTKPTPECSKLLGEMHNQIGHVDLYNVYGSCINGNGKMSGAATGFYKAPLGERSLQGPDACIDSIYASDYFNRADVIKAIHVRNTTKRWATCYTEPGWSYQSTRPNLPRDTYPLLLDNINVIIYNGDVDACVPWTDNYAWTKGMNLPVSKEWHAWTYSETTEFQTSTQVGGYAVEYKSNNYKNPLTFITIRGGRHEVPETSPKKALELLKHLINNEPF